MGLGHFILCLLLVVPLGGCGYHLGFKARQLPGGYDHVAIPVFKNKTPEVGIETYFTNELIRQFARSGVARVVERSDAAVTLEGVIENLTFERGAKSTQKEITHLPLGTVLTTEYRVLVTTRLRLRRNSDDKVLWESVFQSERPYFAPQLGSAGLNSSNALYNQSARHQNVFKIATDMMVEAHDRVTESF
ncbi:MAG: LptE family protein [Bdellovibrionales bacterium]|nr:LptE family protein [Bdellovibrionales bacterium]